MVFSAVGPVYYAVRDKDCINASGPCFDHNDIAQWPKVLDRNNASVPREESYWALVVLVAGKLNVRSIRLDPV